jgi:hypothetical protein
MGLYSVGKPLRSAMVEGVLKRGVLVLPARTGSRTNRA